MTYENRTVEVNGKIYAWPKEPVVVVCVDGSEPAYMEKAIKDGCMPYMDGVFKKGMYKIAKSVVPSFTNPNNLSIVTGAPPSVHGICGNFFYDAQMNTEVMMNDPKYLRADTILASFGREGAKVAVVTAKDKLRGLLGYKLENGICFSAEKADQTTEQEHGIADGLDFVGMDLPSVYSAELSEFVFAAGVKIMSTIRPDIMYLSTTDYIQHKHAPGTEVANAFYGMMDGYLKQLDDAGATIVVTADHGMKPKTDGAGKPQIVFLQEHMDTWYGDGVTRVILPITDPYVVHHGALGAFATIHLPEGIDATDVCQKLRGVEGVTMAMAKKAGCLEFELPEDRMGDIIVVSGENTVLGTSTGRHDLSELKVPLRSHGGVTEQRVPLICNRRVTKLPDGYVLRNFSSFDVALNYAQA
ncbi:MAG: phosphonoacetate hydrolase [Myxococcota bacterium]|nr:phosphonoacetate hydrolase [Myxococcota bacterium]